MDLYTMNENFLPKDEVDEYVSAIWTERYWAAGDVRLVVPETPTNREKLTEGTMLALVGSDEVMILDTVSIEDKLMTIVGSSLPYFLNNRQVWFKNPDTASEEKVQDYVNETKKPGEFISDVVDKMIIHPVAFTGSTYTEANLEWDLEVIEFLQLGAIDHSGVAKKLTAPIGPLYDSIQPIAEKEHVGISLYLESADASLGYVLRFMTYQGLDRTSTQTTNPLVRLVPDLDSLSKVKELRSVANWKNVCYVYYKGKVTTHYEDPANIPTGFNRRVIVTNPTDEPVGHKPDPINRPMAFQSINTGGRAASPLPTASVGSYSREPLIVTPADETKFRDQNAKDALANHNYIRTIDGETSPHNDYTFGVDYGLGDLIELESLSRVISKARITEYIRSEDETGHKEYPTISVLTPEDD